MVIAQNETILQQNVELLLILSVLAQDHSVIDLGDVTSESLSIQLKESGLRMVTSRARGCVMKQDDPIKEFTTTVTDERHTVPEEMIRQRAFELYERRGRENGHDLEDWLRAETELFNKAA